MTQPPQSVADLVEALETRSFTTYKARVRAYDRIQARSRAWNTALIALATSTTIAAVGLLVDDTMYGESGDLALAAYAILSLAASLAVAAVDYPGRAVKMETSYKEIQHICSLVEAERVRGSGVTIDRYLALHSSYSDLIRHSENHTTADYDAQSGKRTWRTGLSATLTLLPYASLIFPAWLILAFGTWVVQHS